MLELDVPAIESTETTRGVELRDLEAADWEAVADIYWDGIRDGLATFETAIPSWEDWAAAHPPGFRLVAEPRVMGPGEEIETCISWPFPKGLSSDIIYAGHIYATPGLHHHAYVANGSSAARVAVPILRRLLEEAAR